MFDFCDILGGAEPKNESHPIELILQPYTPNIITNLFPKFGDDRTCLIFEIFWVGREKHPIRINRKTASLTGGLWPECLNNIPQHREANP